MGKDAKTARKKRRLGRGLSSLVTNSVQIADDDQTYQHVTGLPPIVKPATDTPASSPEPTVNNEIATDSILANPFQPRHSFDEEQLAELAQSILQQGILQPLIVSPSHDGADKPYMLIAGERRLRAAQQLNMPTVPCIVRKASRQQMLEWALVENIQRADLSPLDNATSYRDYIDRFNLTQAQAAERLGTSRADIANHLRILDLPDSVLVLLSDSTLSFGHAKVLAGLAGQPNRQESLASKVVKKGLSVRQLEGLIEADSPVTGDDQGSRQTRRAKAQLVFRY